jgi:hypothetical protein
MAAMSRLTKALVARSPAPSVTCAAPAGNGARDPLLRAKPAGIPASGRLDASLVSRSHGRQKGADAPTASPDRALIEAVQADIRAQNAEMERHAQIGYVDLDIMEPWQRRRRFG